jgi:phosphohistidine phosphatase
MDLLIIRHGIAEDKDVFATTGQGDDLRPLTEKGRKKMARVARGLRAIVPQVALFAASPLVRARETADIVAREYGGEIGEITETLRPDASLDDFVEWLDSRGERTVVAVVGHEPHLGALATWLMCGTGESHIELKKGGACLVSFDDRPKRGGATLHWLMTPAQLEAQG